VANVKLQTRKNQQLFKMAEFAVSGVFKQKELGC